MEAIAQTSMDAGISDSERNNSTGKRLFTSLTAAEFGRRSWVIRRQRKIAQDEAKKLQPLIPLANPLHTKVLEQMQAIDEQFERAKPADLPRLAQAKAQLWQLLFPKPRPARGSTKSEAPKVD